MQMHCPCSEATCPFISPPISPAGRKCEVPGSKSHFVLSGTRIVNISCSIWPIFIISFEIYLENEPVSVYYNTNYI